MRVAALLDRINHLQLLYFWTAIREGGVGRAAENLRLSKATVSGQIKKLQASLGHRLWQQQGRKLQVTAAGAVVYDYAERIFALGEEMLQVLDGEADRRQQLRVGIANGVPQLVAYRLIQYMIGDSRTELCCDQGPIDDLLDQLGSGRLHLVLNDGPVAPGNAVTTHNHLIDESAVGLFAVPKLAARYRQQTPESLAGAPLLLPATGTELRRSLRRWLDEHGVPTVTVGEFANTALLKIFGSAGLGLFPAPLSVADHIQQAFGCVLCRELDGCRERCFAVTTEARPRHPLVARLLRRFRLHA